AQAAVPGITWNNMVRRYRTEGQRQQGRGITRNGMSERKHEAELVYVANSEPARWCWGGGRAGVTERDLISGEPN
ncbi:MAG: hypothetical protein KAV99_05150, partial [Candidatus Latescibacteria bacterium]|nr:hypothetical protein [Candidatus Latescibacterota bacterium]